MPGGHSMKSRQSTTMQRAEHSPPAHREPPLDEPLLPLRLVAQQVTPVGGPAGGLGLGKRGQLVVVEVAGAAGVVVGAEDSVVVMRQACGAAQGWQGISAGKQCEAEDVLCWLAYVVVASASASRQPGAGCTSQGQGQAPCCLPCLHHMDGLLPAC